MQLLVDLCPAHLCAALAPLGLCFDCPVVTCEGWQRWAFAKCSKKSRRPLRMGTALALVF